MKISRRPNVEDYLNRFNARLTSQLNDANGLLNIDFLIRESEAKFDRNSFPDDDYKIKSDRNKNITNKRSITPSCKRPITKRQWLRPVLFNWEI